MRRSKYPSLGIVDAIEKLLYGGSGADLWESFKPSKKGVDRNKLWQVLQKQDKSILPRQFSQSIYKLKSRGLIDEDKNRGLLVKEKGHKFLLKSLANVVFKNKNTDGYSRLIVFDIPERRRNARDMLRRKLKEFECQQIQKSVYVTPYVCENEIREVSKILGVMDHIYTFKIFENSGIM